VRPHLRDRFESRRQLEISFFSSKAVWKKLTPSGMPNTIPAGPG